MLHHLTAYKIKNKKKSDKVTTSKNFYENNGEPPVKSGLDESHFTMTLAGFDDAIMHWVDVPAFSFVSLFQKIQAFFI